MTDHIADAGEMVDRLPYQLTKGVTATREGLKIEWGNPIAQFFSGARKDLGMSQWTAIWPDAAERLRYREGEPYCDVLDGGLGVHCYPHYEPSVYPRLHRLAAILCDTAEGFRILHWCITNLSGGKDGE